MYCTAQFFKRRIYTKSTFSFHRNKLDEECYANTTLWYWPQLRNKHIYIRTKKRTLEGYSKKKQNRQNLNENSSEYHLHDISV